MSTEATLARRLSAEALGTALLLAAVVGSGIMGERLAAGNIAVALLANTLATAAILVVLIEIFTPVSGAHFNPVVTGMFWMRGEIGRAQALAYVLAQIAGAILGVAVAHVMFDLPIAQSSNAVRAGTGQFVSEIVAAGGLVLTILGIRRARPEAVPQGVGLFIASAYWFTASTSFANPAVTIARAFTETFAGIRLIDVPLFVLAQCIGAGLGAAIFSFMIERTGASEPKARL